MSTTGHIRNYYVDSWINHEREDVLASRFSARELLPTRSRQTTVVPGCSDYPSCSFAPKPSVFTSSWGPVHSQSSVVYHPYTHQPHVGTDSRYVRSWLEPISGTVSFPGYPANCRHYGLKPDGFPQPSAGDCITSNNCGYPDYFYNTCADILDQAQQSVPSPESEVLASEKHKDDKTEFDPSKWKPCQSTNGYRSRLCVRWRCSSSMGFLLVVVVPL